MRPPIAPSPFRPRLMLTGFALLLCAAAPPALALTAAGVAPVEAVVLYPGSALIERGARVRAGDAMLEIPGIPANFDAETLRVEAEPGIDVGEITLRDSARSGPLNAEEARLEDAVREMGERIAALDVDRQAAERELAYLDSLPPAGLTAQPADLPAFLATMRESSSQAQRRILAADAQKQQLARELAALQSDLERVRPAVSTVRTLQIRLAAQRDGKVRILYQLAEAGWRPAYRAMLDSDKGEVGLERMAQIAQRSGEDWSGVKLRLSTGQPRQRVSGPDPQPWDVTLQPERRGDIPPVAALEAMPAPAPMMRSKAAAAPEPQAPLFDAAEVHGEFATEYVIAAPLSIPADGRKVSVSLSRQDLPVKLQVQVSPRLEQAAYLMARAELPEGVWPVGEMQLYRNGAYVGSRRWDASQHKGLELPFGRDELVKVSVKSLIAKNASSGFIGQLAERQVADAYTVTNLHKRPVDLLVLEPSPVSRDEKIEVTTTFKPEVGHKDWDGRTGVAAWTQRLDAGASQTFSAEYRVRWPKDRAVVGLP